MPALPKRMAPRQPSHCHPPSPQPSMPRHGHIRVLAARWQVLALRNGQRMQYWRHDALIKAQQRSRHPLAPRSLAHDAFPSPEAFAATRSYAACTARKITATSRSIAANSASMTLRLGCSTTSTGAVNRGSARRTASRSLRLMRFRSTALPSALGTVRPTRGPAVSLRRSAGRSA